MTANNMRIESEATAKARQAFIKAFECGKALEIRHHGQDKWVKFFPHSVGPLGAAGIMPDDSGAWPRSARFSEIAETRDPPDSP